MDPGKKTFKYRYSIKASDIWQVRMYYAYASYLAVVNIICIVAAVVLIITLWKTAADWFRVAMLIFLSLFTVVQPLVIYLNARKQVKGNEEEMELDFSDNGLKIDSRGKTETHGWNEIVSFTVKPTLVIVYTGQSHGYILTNRILGESRKDFIAFVREGIKNNRKR